MNVSNEGLAASQTRQWRHKKLRPQLRGQKESPAGTPRGKVQGPLRAKAGTDRRKLRRERVESWTTSRELRQCLVVDNRLFRALRPAL